MFSLGFHPDQYEWKHKLIPFEISNNESDSVVDLLIYKNHCALIKNLHVFLGDHNFTFVCRRGLSSYSSPNILVKYKQRCDQQEIFVIGIPNEYHVYWTKHFHKNSSNLRIYVDFEADNEIDN